MDFTAVVASLLRRWYITLAGLLAAAGLVVAAVSLVPPTYSAMGSVLLLPPTRDLTDGANPLLQLGGLEQPAALAVAYLTGDEAHQQFAEAYPDAQYDVELDTLSRGPLVVFTVEAPTPDGVIAALHGAVGLLPTALATLQDNVDAPQNSWVRSTPLSIDPEASTVTAPTLRAAIAAAGVGLVLAFAGAVALDSLLTRRAERKAQRDESAGDAAPSAPVQPDFGDDAPPWTGPRDEWPPVRTEREPEPQPEPEAERAPADDADDSRGSIPQPAVRRR